MADNEPLPKYHPACLHYPELSLEELQDLADDIKARGLIYPIVRYQGKILEGRNRDKACKLAGVEPRYVEWDGKGSPEEYAFSANVLRRHLTASQRAAYALELLPRLSASAKDRQRLSPGRGHEGSQADPPLTSGRATDHAAKLLRTNRRYVEALKKIAEKAPHLVQAVREGKLSIAKAEKLAIPPESHSATPTSQVAHRADERSTPTPKTTPALAGIRRYAAMALLSRESFGSEIWDPAAGDLAIAKALQENNYHVHTSNLKTAPDVQASKLLAPSIVTHPPQNIAVAFALHVRTLQVHKLAMLLPLEFLHGKSRHQLFSEPSFSLRGLYVFVEPLRDRTGKPLSWFVWERGSDYQPVIDWLSTPDEISETNESSKTT